MGRSKNIECIHQDSIRKIKTIHLKHRIKCRELNTQVIEELRTQETEYRD